MCGINGLLYFDRGHAVERDLIDAMRAVATHRGPDDHGLYLNANVGFGFNRLSIIDLSAGHQPMTTEGSASWIVFNGEIYNFAELREELIARGRRFRTRSDTETILQAWEEYGENCVDHLRGMFAFAIWDERRRVLFAARDRIGIKPFYYYVDGSLFAFASEVKSLLELPEMPRRVDPQALSDYLHHGYVIAPNTILQDVKKLPPGHCITIRENAAAPVHVRRYWDPPYDPSPRPIPESEALEQLAAMLDEVVRMHLVSDVPLGAFLSGGIDSSSVVALMSRLEVPDIKTFSIGYDSAESELDYARIVAEHFHTDHYELRLTAASFREFLPKIVWHMDEPVADAPSIPLFYLSEFARKRVTVALSGEGSDEIFAGYPIYKTMTAMEKLNAVPGIGIAGRALAALSKEGKIKKYAAMLGQPLEVRYGGVSRVFEHPQAARLMNGSSTDALGGLKSAYARCAHLQPLARMGYVDLTTWLPDDLLVKADRMSMAASLELRVPFLDHKLVEFAAKLPLNLKLRGNTTKYLLKRYMEPILPREITHRAKKGFPVPKNAWFRNDLAGFARETLLASVGPCSLFFPRAELEYVLAEHQRRDCSDQIYALLVFDEWYRTFMKPASLGAEASSCRA